MSKHDILLPSLEKAPVHTSNIVPWVYYFISPYKWTVLFFACVRAFRYTWISLMPVAIGYVIGGLESEDAFLNPQHYITFLICYFSIYAVVYFNFMFKPEAAAVEKASRGLTLHSINHINRLSLNWHEQQGSGGKLQKVMTGRKGFQELWRHMRWDFFVLIGDAVAIVVTMVLMDIPLSYSIFYVLFIASHLTLSWYLSKPYLAKYDKFHEKLEKLLSGVYEFVSAVRTTKSFYLNDHISRKAGSLETEGQEAIMNAFHSNFIRWTSCNMLGVFWISVFAFVGFSDVLNKEISVGAYAAMFFLASRIWSSCDLIGGILEKVYEYGNGIHRLVQMLCIQPDKVDIEPIQSLPEKWKTVSLNDVSYAYAENKDHGIKNMSFTVKRGQKIAFVGNSGAGKSTLVKILMKQMLPHSGTFTVDDTDISHIQTPEWLSQIGFVPQDIELFNLSVRENILVDRDDVSDDQLKEVLKQAALDEFVEGLPQGLSTMIGERGIKLSGGQRQRLGIARALIRQAPIMIFDEATSSLDSISESKIQNAIENSFEDRTVFVIAHRLSTIQKVDRIIVLDHGKIIEDGSFDALIKQKGHFAKLWSMQTEFI